MAGLDASKREPHEFVDAVLAQAVAAGASDVYWLPERENVAVRVKVAGVEQALATVPRAYGEQCVARLKVLAGLLTYRSAIAQDGAIRGVNGHADTELRVATMPTTCGERVTIRVLSRRHGLLRLDELGFASGVVQVLRDLLVRPTGMLVLTGPTGSGKTTTIYALIRELLDRGADPASIITIEDPVECEVPAVSQVQVTRAGEGWGYDEALRAALRQDVKTLVIGEMRDAGVVRVALDAALTGHRIVTTYHAGDIPGVYARLLHQGFEPFLVAGAVSGVLAQRLVPAAAGTGQVPVAAVLRVDDAWRDVVIATPGLDQLRRDIRRVPGADLEAAAHDLAAAGRIREKDALVL